MSFLPSVCKKIAVVQGPLRERSPLERFHRGGCADTSDKTDKRILASCSGVDQSFVRDPMPVLSSQGERDLSKSRIVLRAVSDLWVEVGLAQGLVASR